MTSVELCCAFCSYSWEHLVHVSVFIPLIVVASFVSVNFVVFLVVEGPDERRGRMVMRDHK